MRLPLLFLLAIVVLQLHMVEQLLFGLDELYELQAMVGSVTPLFSDADRAAVVLVFTVVTIVLLLCYGFMTGGVPRLIAASFFGVEFMFESHHIVKTIVRGAYFPGAVTAIAFVTLGALILVTARREFRQTAASPMGDTRLRLSNI
jgi:hypothetical protein